jgi:flagellar biosynthetic protein FlhB
MKQLRMSKQEIKEEHRQAEGDPFVKSSIRARQQALSRNRMLSEVATSTVVMVNPTHVAVALRYQPGSGAPLVVAKGKGEVAARIRAEAEKHGVPIVRHPPLARALESACKLGTEIPRELYEAVAHLLAFVFSLGERAKGRVLTAPGAALASALG